MREMSETQLPLGLDHQSAYIPSRRGTWLPDPPPEDPVGLRRVEDACPGLLQGSAPDLGPVLPIALVQEEPLEGRGQARSGH